MKIQAHDANYSFDYVAWINAVFDRHMELNPHNDLQTNTIGLPPHMMFKLFRYERVSLPTMLWVETQTGVRMSDFVIKIN